MANTKRYIVEIDADTGQLVRKVEAGKKEMKGLDNEAKNTSESFNGLTSQLDAMTGGLLTMGRKGLQGVRGLTAGFKTLRGAIISTGIGAIVVAVVSLIQAVSRLQGVQDKYKQATAALGAVFDVLLDSVAFIGEALINVFQNPQQAIEDLWELIKENIVNRFNGLIKQFKAAGKILQGVFELDFDKVKEGTLEYGDAIVQTATGVENLAEKMAEYGNELAETARKAAELQKAEQELEDLRISQIETQAKRSKQIAQARLDAEDETKSLEERTKALEDAIRLEQLNLQEKLDNAREEARIIEERNKLAESDRKDLKAEAEAKAAVFQLEEQSLKQQKRLATELESLRREQQAAEDKRLAEQKKRAEEREKLRQEELKKQMEYERELIKAQDEIDEFLFQQQATQEEKEIKAIEDKYNKLLDMADKFGLDRAQIEEAREAEYEARRKKQEEKEKADEKRKQQSITDIINASEMERDMTEDEKFFADLAKKEEKALIELEQMGATRQQIEELQANFDEQRSAKEKEISDQRVANEKALQRQKVDLALEAGQALSGLMEAFGGESEKNARRVFNVNKALGIAEVVINTARAIQAQLAVPQDALTGANFVKAGIAAAMGAAQVAKIASTQFQGGGGGGGGGGGRGGGAPSIPSTAGMVATGAPQLPQPEAPDQSQQSIRAFVVEKNVTDAQSQNQKINEQASLTI